MLNIKINYKLVDTAGQITAVVFDEENINKFVKISNYLMNKDTKIEQVVFASENEIQTMGGELCINGSFAGAYLLKNLILQISGINKKILFSKKEGFISAKFPIDLFVNKFENIILLQGIVYIISNNKKFANKEFLKKLANKFNVPASGIVLYKDNKITPIIYVKDTNSLVWERACGSGSLAYFLFSKTSKIKQPSGDIIEINKTKKYFTIKVPVKIVI